MGEGEHTEKRCVICRADLVGKPRVRDAKGNYVCTRYAETRERCELAVSARPAAVAAGAADELDDALSGLDQLVAAEAEAEGVHAPIAVAIEPLPDHSCPVCARTMPPESASCAGCGYRRDAGIKSSLLLKKTQGEHGMTVICPKCRYDMGAGASLVCTECGARAPLATKRASEQAYARSVARDAYLHPLITFAVCAAIMLAVASMTGGAFGLAAYSIEFGATMVLGWLVYTALCVVMLGFDAPQHLIVLRLAAVYAASDVAFYAAGFVPIPLLPWIFALLVYISLLTHFLECELSEAMILVAGTFAAKAIAVLLLAAWLIGMLG